jgi:hypothetical protein
MADPLMIAEELVHLQGRSARPRVPSRVDVDATDMDRLLAYVQAQSMSASDVQIAAEQRAAVANAKRAVERLPVLIRELLEGVLPRYGIATAARSCANLIHMQMARTVAALGRYQIDAADVVLTNLDVWFDRDALWPTLVQRLFGVEVAAEIVIARTSFPRPPEPFATIYLPDQFLGERLPKLAWIPMDNVDSEIWTDVVLPQYIGSPTWNESAWRPWVPFGVLSVFEGERWRGADRLERE